VGVRLQEEIVVDVKITKPSLYRLVFYYVNLNSNNVLADITVTPEASSDVQQTSTVVFAPTSKPQFVTVSGAGLPATAFVLNPGQWTISLKAPENLLVVSRRLRSIVYENIILVESHTSLITPYLKLDLF
jgi:laminin alpha 3/5